MNAEIHCPRRLLCLAGMLCVRLFSEKKKRRIYFFLRYGNVPRIPRKVSEI